MKNFVNIIANHWLYRIIFYLVSFVLLIVVYTIISNLININQFAAQNTFSITFNFINLFLVIIPLYLLELIRGARFCLSLGIQIDKYSLGYIFRAFIYSFFSFIIVLAVAYFLNQVKLLEPPTVSNLLLFHIFGLLIAAFLEEIIFRGLILQSLNMRFSDTTSLIVSSLLFMFAHSMNPGFSLIAAINTFFAGALLAFMYLKTRNLWLPIFFHFFWNLFEEIIIGSNVSGFSFPYAFAQIEPKSPFFVLLFGNNYGFENSIFCTIILISVFYLINKFETLNPYNSSYRYKLNYKSDNILLKNEINK